MFISTIFQKMCLSGQTSVPLSPLSFLGKFSRSFLQWNSVQQRCSSTCYVKAQWEMQGETRGPGGRGPPRRKKKMPRVNCPVPHTPVSLPAWPGLSLPPILDPTGTGGAMALAFVGLSSASFSQIPAEHFPFPISQCLSLNVCSNSPCML